jgi:predicted NBD/HSP70 family sugar kinase
VTTSTAIAASGTGQAVLLEVLRHGPLSRSELALRLGMSPASLTRLTAPWVESGLLREIEVRREQRSGRPSRPVEVVPEALHFAGVRLTDEHAFAVLTDLAANVVATADAPLVELDPDSVITVVAGLLGRLAQRVPSVTRLGVSLGGDSRDHRVVSHAPFLAWNDVPLARALEAASGISTVVENDLTALTKAEHWFGAGRRSDRFAVITVGVGVGYGLVMHDRVVEGTDTGVGLLGHFPLDRQGRWCSQGHRGCAATLLTIPAITSAVSLGLSRPVGYEECLELARHGDLIASAVVRDAVTALARLIAAVCSIAMVHRVVITGEGVGLVDADRDGLAAAIEAERDVRASDVELEVQPHDVVLWARGAAVAAIQSWATSTS